MVIDFCHASGSFDGKLPMRTKPGEQRGAAEVQSPCQVKTMPRDYRAGSSSRAGKSHSTIDPHALENISAPQRRNLD